jgi:hypothetical protein
MERLPWYGLFRSRHPLLCLQDRAKGVTYETRPAGHHIPLSAAQYAPTGSHRCATRGELPNNQVLAVIGTRVAARNQRQRSNSWV